MTDPTGGPAFPAERAFDTGVKSWAGMSLRDWFAGQFLCGVASDSEYTASVEHMARAAYAWADAMLIERET